MRWDINSQIAFNSYDYFDKTLITDNGFREYDVRWQLGKEINPNGILVLGRAYGTYLLEIVKENRVVVGHDFRSYSQDLCRSLIAGLLSTGIDVIDIGLALTPMVYFAQHHFGTKGGVIVTASHNENGWTGLKLANGLSSTLGPQGILEFKEIVKSGKFATGRGGYESYDDVFDAYAKDIVGGIKLKKPIKVVVASGNGTAGRFAPQVLRELGCDLVELHCDGDWDFPNCNPNPEDLSFLHMIEKVARENNADIGIGIDGDGDRIGAVDDKGREIFSDKLGLLLARWISNDHPGRSVVIDVKSTGLYYDDATLTKNKMAVVTWKTGHSYIKEKVAETNAIAGFEKSGHFFFNEPYGRGYDDAIRSAVNLLRMLDSTDTKLSEMIDGLPPAWSSPTLGPFCADDVKYDVVEEMTEKYRADYEAGTPIAGSRIRDLITVNGVRFVLENDSWGLVRASSNKPSLVLVAESRSSEDELYEIMDNIQKRLEKTGKVGEYDQKMPPRSGK